MSQIPLFPTRSGSGRGLFEWHPAGQRIVKTSLAVTITLFFYMFLGYKGENMQAEAAITAIICMQPYVHGSAENAANRLGGTIIGACWGFLFLMLCPLLGKNRPLLYLFMGLGTLITLHSTVLLRVPDTAGLAAIVFVCVVIAYPDIENPLDQAFHRILGVLVGNTVAIAINTVRLPRRRHPEKLFFIHMDSLTENQLSRMEPPVRFRLQRLYQDGAKICLMSSHAPAFNASEDYTVPMIVMDGAAIFDARENTYLTTSSAAPS